MTEAVAMADQQGIRSQTAADLRRRRYAADARLRLYGIVAILSAVGLLGVLLVTLIIGGAQAFVQTHARVDFPISAEHINADDLPKSNWRAIVSDGAKSLWPELTGPKLRDAAKLMTNNTQFFVRDAVVRDPSVIGKTVTLEVPLSDPFDQLNKGAGLRLRFLTFFMLLFKKTNF